MADADTTKGPIFEAFRWADDDLYDDHVTVPGRVFADLTNTVRDIASGVATILEIMERDRLAKEDGERAMLPHIEAESLSRLAIQAAKLLEAEAQRGAYWAAEHRTVVAQLRKAMA